MLIMLSGKQGSGKTTASNLLEKKLTKNGFIVKKYKFAQPLYEMHDGVIAVLEKYGIVRNIVKDGPLLQMLGTEYGRNTIDKDIWVKCAQNWYAQNKKDVCIIDDLRFKNEFMAFPEAFTVRLECNTDIRMARCSNWRENDKHPSEIDLDDWVIKFKVIVNSGIITTEEIVGAILERLLNNLGLEPGKELFAGRNKKGVEGTVQ
ncbi:MAG: hypothetical protein EBZ49_00595 [Proteobacteria bacterium]|nr:hypothetical protein [Pseudomonadota bacterium]